LAVAILVKAEADKVNISQSDSFEALSGRGVQCKVEGKAVLLGNRKLMQEQNISISKLEADLTALEAQEKPS
jgi:Cu+-exporting ATPase